MIEPLRLNRVYGPVASVQQPLFCEQCRTKREFRRNPNVAIKYCSSCPLKKFFCKVCDEEVHRLKPLKSHIRNLLVVGKGVKKKVVADGDRETYPVSFDKVKIQLKCKAYQEGVLVYKEKWKDADYISGLSGDTIHVQVLGVRNILATSVHGASHTSNSVNIRENETKKDYNGNNSDGNDTSRESLLSGKNTDSYSNPFMTCSYNGFELGETRLRERTLSAVWTNETFIIPIDDIYALRQMDADLNDHNEYIRYVPCTYCHFDIYCYPSI